MINGEEVSRYKAPVITEYVDMITGEILSASTLKGNSKVWPTIRASERALQREFILNSLRREVREFAWFVLEFRNHRRGITPHIEQLVKWYSQLTSKQCSHARRYVKTLEDAGVIAGSSLLGPLFQIAGRSTAAKDHLSEEVSASSKFLQMQFKKQSQRLVSVPLLQAA